MPLAIADLQPLLGLGPDSPQLTQALVALAPDQQVERDAKSYPDATYHNYYSLGLSLCFIPRKDAGGGTLELESIDIFNPAPETSATASARRPGAPPAYTFPPAPVTLRFAETEIVFPPRKPGEKELRVPRPDTLELKASTSGREVVRSLGEPSRKGSGGWVGVWLEWGAVALKREENGERVEVGLMLELKDPKGSNRLTKEQEDQGVGGVWDQASGWRWAGIKVFRPSK